MFGDKVTGKEVPDSCPFIITGTLILRGDKFTGNEVLYSCPFIVANMLIHREATLYRYKFMTKAEITETWLCTSSELNLSLLDLKE